ncbi:ca-transporting atpase [Ceraceosorus bombacis]|uniref:Cation-transporting ATPase n=1 Tax=Ceraceosorus bombacis TaxID=401625 RepID=A0A0P1BET7_9BASI|nr:ca-transporting atpase [Ceraceosorus bombacis]
MTEPVSAGSSPSAAVFRFLEPGQPDAIDSLSPVEAPDEPRSPPVQPQEQHHRAPAPADADDIALSAQVVLTALEAAKNTDKESQVLLGELGGVAHTIAGADVMPGGTDDKQGGRVGERDMKGIEGTSREERLLIPSLMPCDATAAGPQAEAGSKQAIYLPSDDLQLYLTFHCRPLWRRLVWYAMVLLTAGIAWIVAFYAPRLWLKINCSPTLLVGEEQQARARQKGQVWVAVKTAYEPLALVRLKQRSLSEPVLRKHVFTESLRLPPSDVIAHISGAARPRADTGSISEARSTLSSLSLLSYRSVTLLLTPVGFVPLGDWRDSGWTSRQAFFAGLASSDGQPGSWRRTMFGLNEIIVETKSWGRLTVDEALHPFYIFSLCSIALWSYDEYQWYALVIGVISIAGIAASVITAKRALQRLQQMSRFECDVSVLRPTSPDSDDKGEGHAQWHTIRSTELLPGDVIDVASTEAKLDTLPCDCVLLESEAISSEAMLTGEAVPVAKSACPTSLLLSVLSSGQPFSKLDKHLLYGGTQIVRSRPGPSSDRSAKALVIQTGFETIKGSLVRQMLFPKPLKHHFYADAFKFIGILALIAFCGFIGSLVYFITIGVDRVEIALRALDLFTICVPPALPAAMSVCTSLAIARLRGAGIFVTSPARINVAGKTSCVVFDKTGTLTEAHLDVLGVRNACRATSAKTLELSDLLRTRAELEEDTKQSREQVSLAEALATAHDLNMLDGKTIGEPLEQSMFAWTGATLDDEAATVELQSGPGDVGQTKTTHALTSDGTVAKVPIVRCVQSHDGGLRATVRKFAFESGLRRMSVIVKSQAEVGARIFTKGAPEAIGPLCRAESLPRDYEAVLDEYTHKGFRVLALAGKSVTQLSWQHAQTMVRSQAESQLTFLGLLVFENPLKEGTRSALARLHAAALKAADVGLSLSEAEASVAAPFTSKDADIGCIDHLIREGRNSLCTSLNLFSWMLIYSLAEFWSVTLLYTVATSFDNAEYLYIDVLIVLPIAIGMANNRPAPQLSRKRPPSRLMSRRVVLSLLSQMVLLILAQATVYLLLHRQHDFYEAPILDPENLELSDQDNTILFKTSTFTYIIAAIIYSWGPPHRQHVWKNWFLSLAIVTITAFNFAFLFINSDGPFFSLFAFHSVPLRFLFVVMGVVLIQGLLAFVVEILLIDRAAAALQPLVESFRRWKLSNRRAKEQQRRRKDDSSEPASDGVEQDAYDVDIDARKAHRRIMASIAAE